MYNDNYALVVRQQVLLNIFLLALSSITFNKNHTDRVDYLKQNKNFNRFNILHDLLAAIIHCF